MKKSNHIYGNVVAIGVDIQNDFCPAGSLEVADGDLVVQPFNLIAEAVRRRNGTVALTRDWHPSKTKHFGTPPDFETTWPVHCVANTEGAAFHPELETDGAKIFSKGMKKDEDAYSGFMGMMDNGTTLLEELSAHREPGQELTLIIGGLATDYCVKATVLDAVSAGYDVIVPVDAVKAVSPVTGAAAFEEMLAAGVELTTTEQVLRRLG